MGVRPDTVRHIDTGTGLDKSEYEKSGVHEFDTELYPGPGQEPFTTTDKIKLDNLSSDPGGTDCALLNVGAYIFWPLDSSVYYFGNQYNMAPATSSSQCCMDNPREGTVYIRSGSFRTLVTGALGTVSSGTGEIWARINDAQEYYICGGLNCSSAVDKQAGAGLNIPWRYNEPLEFVYKCPVWSSNPSSVRLTGTLWVDAVGSGEALDPVVVTASPLAIGANYVTMQGYLTSMGDAATVTLNFEYGLTESYGSTTTAFAASAIQGWQSSVGGLAATTEYHYRARGVSSAATVVGADIDFTTGGTPSTATLYGSYAYSSTSSVPIGGGAGYNDIKTSGNSTATSAAALRSILATATNATVFVPGYASLDFSGTVEYTNRSVRIHDGVTLASDRGFGGTSTGARIYTDTNVYGWWHLFQIHGNNVRITGFRLEGPSSATDPASYMGLLTSTGYYGLEVDNCEIYDWPYGGICYYTDGAASTAGVVDWDKAGHFHHNYIHHCRKSGLGYGIQLASCSALIECNNFNNGRHFISGERDGGWYPQGYYANEYKASTVSGTVTYTYGYESTAPTNGKEVYHETRYNVFGYGAYPEITNSMVDQHGGSDTYLRTAGHTPPVTNPATVLYDRWGPYPEYGGLKDVWAGGSVYIHHNDFLCNQTVYNLRGIPKGDLTIEYNWIKTWSEGSKLSAVRQRLYTLTNTPGYVDRYYYNDPATAWVANTGASITVANNWWGTATPPT